MHYKPFQLLFILIALTGGCAICAAATPSSNGGTMPSMPDILDVINKATTPADDAPAEWTAPVKLVIVFTALALIPSLMDTESYGNDHVLYADRYCTQFRKACARHTDDTAYDGKNGPCTVS
ncbi:MAG: hypothetical protein ACYSWP_25950 [Planctomycetota bacterium]|jgi:hypothetical protein